MVFKNQGGSAREWNWTRHGITFHPEDQEFTLSDLSSELDVALEKLLDIVGNELLSVRLVDANQVEQALKAKDLPELRAAIASARVGVQKCRHCGRRNP